METHLIDPDVRTGLANVLGEIGGRNIDECVKRVMKFIISDTLATKLNMSGRNKKKAFGPTNLFGTVYRGVKMNSQTSDCTRRNVEHAVAKWLIGEGIAVAIACEGLLVQHCLLNRIPICVNLMEKEFNYIKNRFLSFVYI